MPYTTTESLPDYVKKYSGVLQRMWLHVFNTTYSKILKETKNVKSAEERAFSAANSVVRKRAEQFGSSRYTQIDSFNMAIDKFLKNF